MSSLLFCDTNVLIRLLAGDELTINLLHGKRVYISVITEMEMQCKSTMTTTQRAIIRDLLANCIIIQLTEAIKERAIKIRLTTRLKLMDAIVGASAVETGIPLVTADDQFNSLRGIDVILLPATT